MIYTVSGREKVDYAPRDSEPSISSLGVFSGIEASQELILVELEHGEHVDAVLAVSATEGAVLVPAGALGAAREPAALVHHALIDGAGKIDPHEQGPVDSEGVIYGDETSLRQGAREEHLHDGVVGVHRSHLHGVALRDELDLDQGIDGVGRVQEQVLVQEVAGVWRRVIVESDLLGLDTFLGVVRSASRVGWANMAGT